MIKGNVLLVDDDRNLLSGFKRALNSENYKIGLATSGAEALVYINDNQVDVVVTDEMMPGMRGSELTSEIRKQHPNILCMILSGQANIESAIKAINEGEIYRYLTKPCHVLDLSMHIRSALEHKHLLQKVRQMEGIIAQQKDLFATLEKEHPGITNIKKDKDGYITLED